MDSGAAVVSTQHYDARGRIDHETDSLGHDVWRHFDGLDRVEWSHRLNARTDSPGEYRTFRYYAGGQLQEEWLGTPGAPKAVRWKTIELDGHNLPETVTETFASADGPRQVVTIAHHDQAGNVYEAVDRRGVTRRTYFDAFDRPASVGVLVSPARQAAFLAAGGDLTGFESERQVATYAYDSAGNKQSETDVHGHTTAYVLDPLYRPVSIVSSEVPRGFMRSGAGTVRWEVRAGSTSSATRSGRWTIAS